MTRRRALNALASQVGERWSQTFNGRRACFAWGFGGQYIFVFRELDLVVAVASATTVATSGGATGGQLFDLLETHILPPGGALDPRSMMDQRDAAQ